MTNTQVDHSQCAAERRDHNKITDELNRLNWIVQIVRTLRRGQELTAEMQKDFVLSQRSDLKQQGSESAPQWMIRLEGVLQQSCRSVVVPS